MNTWYPHWKWCSFDSVYDSTAQEMKLVKDTFDVILEFDGTGPNSYYIWHESEGNTPKNFENSITCNGVKCISYTPNHEDDIYQGKATFYIEDVFKTLPHLEDGESYNLPIGLRTWFVKRLVDQIEKEANSVKKAQEKGKRK